MNPQQKERILISAGISFVILLILGVLASQVLARSEELQNEISRKKRTLDQIGKAAVEYSQAVERTRNVQSRLGADNTPLLSYLENLCKNVQISNPALQVIRPGTNEYYEESSVELRAKGLTVRKVTTLLTLIDQSPRYLRVKFFQLKTPYATPDLLDLTIEVSAYTKKQPPTPAKQKEQ